MQGLGIRVYCNFLILEVGDFKLEVNLFSFKNEIAAVYNEIPKILHLEQQKMD